MNKLLKGLKKFFIPHIHNDYKPHLFREASIFSLTLIAILLLTISAGSTLYIKKTNMTATVLPAVLVDLANDTRVSNNEQILTRSPILDNAAKLKAEDMAQNGYFAHTSPTGRTPWYWFDKAGYTFKYAGENLAIDFNESIDVENAWLNSPTHKANILGNHFTEIGVATVDGIYQGHPTTYVVQMFGLPAVTPNTDLKNVTTIKQPATVKKTIENNLPATVALAPTVKGESVEASQNLETITDTKEFVSVKNTTTEEKVQTSTPQSTHYSSWYQRFIFMTPSYADRIYKIIIWVVLASLLLMMIIEIKRQHNKNIIYGFLLLIIIICLVYINRTMFITNFFT